MINLGNKILILTLLSLLTYVFSFSTVQAKDTYPKLANYYLDFFSSSDYDSLARWDLLVIQPEMTRYNPSFFNLYRQRKPQGKLVAYTYPAFSYIETSQSNYSGLAERKQVRDKIEQNNWWLRDGSGNFVYSWPRVRVVNVTLPAWQDTVIWMLRDLYGMSSWDGIMYDMVDPDIKGYSPNGIDITRNGSVDNVNFVNQQWRQGMTELFSKTRSLIGPNKLIITNGSSIDEYQRDTNGRIFEMFPTPWEGNGSWQASMYQYLRRMPSLNRSPQVYIINGSTNNTGNKNDFKKMRFGLTSALLGDGYFSFDHGTESHQQQWWYDEYDVNLGQADSGYYNLLSPNDDYVRAGLWRRDFTNGVSIVNSTDRDQTFVFNREQFEKIHGSQDRRHNDGTTVNFIRLAPNDGIIMRRTQSDVKDSMFNNGQLVRSFNIRGQQTRNSFFAYKAEAAANSHVVVADLDGNGRNERIIERGGRLIITGQGKPTVTITPYGSAFTGKLSLAVYDFNKNGQKEIVVAPVTGGGPHIKMYNYLGRQLTPGFFAFDPKFRGGVYLAAGDVNGDGRAEIVITPGPGMPSTVKIFTEQGRQLGSFLAYAPAFRGGVTVAVGDVDNDGKQEIVTGPVNGGPHVRIFDSFYRVKGQFMAFDASLRSGARVMVGDTNGDGKVEILAGTANF
ncbi:MAG: putative glycoside hydrolase [Patescibacteria group bacterium]|nr:MAG: putative glycoside hydrolase [Patescibacteria group bacterium]